MLRDDLLRLIQSDIPFVSRPFLWIAQKLETSEDNVIREVKKLKEERIVRQISPIYDTRAVGYDGSLVAFKVDPGRIEEVAHFVSSHPGVSHNYEREDEFNLWFTIAVPPDSKLSLEETVSLMARRSGVNNYVILRTLRTFKIGVKLDYGKLEEREKVELRLPVKAGEISEAEKAVIRESQKDIPLTEKPFEEIARKIGMEEEELLNTLRSLRDRGIIRRFSAILYHRRVGFRANGMVVWRVPPERVEEVGRYLSSFRSVSHCYERTTNGIWRYNLFSMVHGKERDEVTDFVGRVSGEIGIGDYRILFSKREFKKRRVELFSEAFYEWERNNLGLGVRPHQREDSESSSELVLEKGL